MDKITWRYGKSVVSGEVVEKLEAVLGVRLPKSFVDCATQNNGGRPAPCAFDFTERKGAVFHNLLRLEPDEENSIATTLIALSDRLPGGCVPFAADPFGNFLCFKYPAQGEIPVVFWDHEEARGDSISYVCASFEDLQVKLYE